MARFVTEIESTLPPDEAFAYMADFSNARVWDPSVSRAERLEAGPIGPGSKFDLVARFAGRDVQLRYEIGAYDPPSPGASSATTRGSSSRGVRRLFDPLAQRMFDRVGAEAERGMREALNP